MTSLSIEDVAPYGLECVKIWCASRTSYQIGIAGTMLSADSILQIIDLLTYQGSVADVPLKPGLEKSLLQSSLDLLAAINYSWADSGTGAPLELLATFRANWDSSDGGKKIQSAFKSIYPKALNATAFEHDRWVRMLRGSVFAFLTSIAHDRNLNLTSLMRENGLEGTLRGNTSYVPSVPRSVNGNGSSRTAYETGRDWPMPGSPTWPFPELSFGDSSHGRNTSGPPNSNELYVTPKQWEKASSNILPGEQQMIPMLETNYVDWGPAGPQDDIETLPDAASTSADQIRQIDNSVREGHRDMSPQVDAADMQCWPS